MLNQSNQKNMDYNEDFDHLKAILEYANDHLESLNKIQFIGGNEEVIDEIFKRIQQYLKSKGFIDSNNKTITAYDHNLRRITFFLILNTDATFKYNLNDDIYICHVLNVVPQLPKCLSISLIWKLNLSEYFFEIIKYTPCWFALQFYEPAIANLKYFEPYNLLDTIEGLVISIFENICRSEFRNLETIDKKIIFGKFYDHIMVILRQFYTPDIEKFNEWSKVRFHKYIGYAIKHLLDITLYCFNIFENPVKRIFDDKFKMYEIGLDMCRESRITTMKVMKYSPLVEEQLLQIISAILNSLQYNVMLVTLDTFISWVEFDLPENQNLQLVIGERAYHVIERITANDKFKHDVKEQLKYISIRPKTIEEIVRDATIGDILHKLDDKNLTLCDKRIWFNELISRSVTLRNDECLDTIKANTKLITFEHVVKLLEVVKDELKAIQKANESDNISDDLISEEENYEELMKILQKALENFKVSQVADLIYHRIKLFKNQTFPLRTRNFNDKCTEFFNKCSDLFDTHTFLKLCFEDPNYAWNKFFDEACVFEHQIENFVSLSKNSKKLSGIFIGKLLDESFPMKYEEKLYPNLVFSLYHSNIIERSGFLKDFVYKNVTELLEQNQYLPLITIFKILIKIVDKSELALNAPVLIMAGQVMDELRWDILTYSDRKDEILRMCIEFIQKTSKKFLPVASERDKNWIKEKVKSYRLLTQYYFQKYTSKQDDKLKTFDKFLHPNNFAERKDIDEFLTSTYVRCTTKETEWLSRNEELLPHISDVILILNGIISELDNENAIANYRHCILNYVNIVNKFLIPEVSNNKISAKGLVVKILKIIDSAPKPIYDEVFMIFHEILVDIIRHSSLPIEKSFVNEVKMLIGKMKNCTAKELFSEKFKNLI